MELQLKTLRKSINKAYLKETVDRASFDAFKSALAGLLDKIESAEKKDEHEEHFKNFLEPFFRQTGFDDYYINTSGRIDLAVHTGPKAKDPVGVLIEVKRPSNKNEMITAENFNRKAMHEAVLYYLEQRMEEENEDLKQVIVTNMKQWFVFDAQEIERCFYRPSTLRKDYTSWKNNQKVSSNKDFMYDKIAAYMDSQELTLSGVLVDLEQESRYLKAKEDSDPEKKLIPLYKFFTPVYLLKEPFANDSNSLNREFYRELLYILGLEETKKGSTRYIERASEENRQSGSFIENTIRILDAEDHLSTVSESKVRYGDDRSERLFNVALELAITWMNRILFLKLLEAQLYRYHRQDKKFKFIDYETIDGYDELNKLFFQVLARREGERPADVNEKYGHIPYLNSSLFDVSALEHESTRISGLDDHAELPVYGKSVLSDLRGENLSTLHYLFRFLEAYDFSAEGGEEIRRERKSLINASVLGLIFEKINGYKDGSFYTPGFITEYMARETLQKAVRDKFAFTLTPNPSPAGGRGEVPLQAERGEGGTAGEGSNSGGKVEEPGWTLPESLIAAARELRKTQTEAEDFLWKLLRNKQLHGYKFRRQHPVKPGFVLDFYCAKEKLAIELDGGIHNKEEQKVADEERTEILNNKNIRVIRFKNEEIFNRTDYVLKRIAEEIGAYAVSAGEGGKEKGNISMTQIYNAIGRDISIREANDIVNSITICDPAVGSGHFLVSCLNELLAIKSELGILCDVEGKRLRDVQVTVENDELIVTRGDEELFEYDVAHTWRGQKLAERKVNAGTQRIQQALFHEKQQIIENCLFGVDINPNSVKICRLRLWIELLKRAYYTEETLSLNPSPTGRGTSGSTDSGSKSDKNKKAGGEGPYMQLQTLPNIDINIKQGNSLVSRFALDSNLGSVFKDSDHSLEDYKEAVRNYKHTGDRTEKQRLQQLIDDIKEEYSTTLTNNRPINKKLSKARGRLELMQNADLFGEQKFSKKDVKKQKKKVKKLEEQKAEEESGAFYNRAFEWRFEFPEVLDDDGRFTGFDVVIGNPPYGVSLEKDEINYYRSDFESIIGHTEIYYLFIELGLKYLAKPRGILSYIIPNAWLSNKYAKKIRRLLISNYKLEEIINFNQQEIFKGVQVETSIILASKEPPVDHLKVGQQIDEKYEFDRTVWLNDDNYVINFSENRSIQDILEKINQSSKVLSEVLDISNGCKPYQTGYGQNQKGEKLTKEDVKNRIYHSDEKIDETYYEELKGKHVERFYAKSSGSYIKWGSWLMSPKDEKYFFQPKILIRQIIGKTFITTIDKTDAIADQTLYVCVLYEDKDLTTLEFALGLFNSKLYGFFFRKYYSEEDDLFPKIKVNELKRLPFQVPSKEIESQVLELVTKVMNAKKDDPEADTSDL